MAAVNFLDQFKQDIDKSLLGAAKLKPGELKNKPAIGSREKNLVSSSSGAFTFPKVKPKAYIKDAPKSSLNDTVPPPNSITAEIEIKKLPDLNTSSDAIPLFQPTLEVVSIIAPTGQSQEPIEQRSKVSDSHTIAEQFEPPARDAVLLAATPGSQVLQVFPNKSEPLVEDNCSPSPQMLASPLRQQLLFESKQLNASIEIPKSLNKEQSKLDSIIIKGQKILIFKMLCYSSANKIALEIETLEKENFSYPVKIENKQKVIITANHLKKIGIDLEEEHLWDIDEDTDEDIDIQDIEELNARNGQIGNGYEFSYMNPIGNRINQQRQEIERNARGEKITKYRKTLDIYSDEEASVYQKAIAQFLSENQELLSGIIDTPSQKNNIDEEEEFLNDLDDE